MKHNQTGDKNFVSNRIKFPHGFPLGSVGWCDGRRDSSQTISIRLYCIVCIIKMLEKTNRLFLGRFFRLLFAPKRFWVFSVNTGGFILFPLLLVHRFCLVCRSAILFSSQETKSKAIEKKLENNDCVCAEEEIHTFMDYMLCLDQKNEFDIFRRSVFAGAAFT
jgi:hypothetical protein